MAIPFLSDISGKNATFAGTLSLGGGDSTTAQLALKGQQSLLSFIRGTSGDAQFFMSSDSARLYFTHTDSQFSKPSFFAKPILCTFPVAPTGISFKK